MNARRHACRCANGRVQQYGGKRGVFCVFLHLGHFLWRLGFVYCSSKLYLQPIVVGFYSENDQIGRPLLGVSLRTI